MALGCHIGVGGCRHEGLAADCRGEEGGYGALRGERTSPQRSRGSGGVLQHIRRAAENRGKPSGPRGAKTRPTGEAAFGYLGRCPRRGGCWCPCGCYTQETEGMGKDRAGSQHQQHKMDKYTTPMGARMEEKKMGDENTGTDRFAEVLEAIQASRSSLEDQIGGIRVDVGLVRQDLCNVWTE